MSVHPCQQKRRRLQFFGAQSESRSETDSQLLDHKAKSLQSVIGGVNVCDCAAAFGFAGELSAQQNTEIRLNDRNRKLHFVDFDNEFLFGSDSATVHKFGQRKHVDRFDFFFHVDHLCILQYYGVFQE